ncbi:MAG: LamG domain-containing protein [Thermofilum sp.]
MSARRVVRAGGLWFDGKTAYVRVPNKDVLNFGEGNFSVAAWAYPIASLQLDLSKLSWIGGYGSTFGWGLRFDSGVFYIQTDVSPYLWSADSGRYWRYAWYHFVGVRDGDTIKIYVNGVLRKSTSGVVGSVNNTLDVIIGNRGDLQTPFNGIIDDVRIYNRALSDDEIRAIYERGALIRDGLVLHLDFTEYEGSIAYDKSGCGNHATIYGARWVVKKQLRTLPETR